MADPKPRRTATYEELLAVPDHQVAEIIDGELVVSPRPASPHARAASRMGGDVLGPFDGAPGGAGGPGGWWILFEPELHLGPDVVVPDLAGWRHTRMPTVPEVPYFTLAPDWACEVVSPGSESLDRVKKVRIYARSQVPHLWLVNPRAMTLENYRLTGEHWLLVGSHQGADRVRAEPFDAVELDLARWWLTPPPA